MTASTAGRPRWLRRSVRLRLTAWYCLILLATLAAFAVTLYLAARRELLHHHDASLVRAAASVKDVIAEHEDCAQLTPEQRARLDEIGGLILIHEMNGERMVFYRSPASAGVPLPGTLLDPRGEVSAAPWFDTYATSGGLIRVYSAPYRSRVGRIGLVRVMDPLGDVQEPLETLRTIMLLLAPLALVVASGGGWWLADRALRPVDHVTTMAREIDAHDLSLRLPVPPAGDEMARLVDTLNQMIARLESAFEGMKRFTADASHELRTPLATIVGTIDVTLAQARSPDAYVQSLRSIGEDVEGLRLIVDDLLVLARADAGGTAMRSEPFRLDRVAVEVVELMAPAATTAGVPLAVGTLDEVVIEGDELWVRQAVTNLVENAVKFSQGTAVPGPVVVEVRRGDAHADVIVSDRGPGIPEGDLPRIFDRFFRGDAARTSGGGVGLGLAIVTWVMRSHGGTITATNRPDGGARICARFPVIGDSRIDRVAS